MKLSKMQAIEWPEYIKKGFEGLPTKEHSLFLNLKLFDIPNTIKASVRNLSLCSQVGAVSVHPSCVEAALEGTVDGYPLIITREIIIID